MLHESEEEEMDTYAVELNSFVDTVLTKVYDMGQNRDILFSSFNPDICLILSFKQPSIPVLFLTDAGASPVGDIRASSLQEAVRFASRWNLLGIVSQAEPLVLCPRLVRIVKESGLVCVSYGMLNNDGVNVDVSSYRRPHSEMKSATNDILSTIVPSRGRHRCCYRRLRPRNHKRPHPASEQGRAHPRPLAEPHPCG
jgi:glycerophosphoryl diester phosphodiesterase